MDNSWEIHCCKGSEGNGHTVRTVMNGIVVLPNASMMLDELRSKLTAICCTAVGVVCLILCYLRSKPRVNVIRVPRPSKSYGL